QSRGQAVAEGARRPDGTRAPFHRRRLDADASRRRDGHADPGAVRPIERGAMGAVERGAARSDEHAFLPALRRRRLRRRQGERVPDAAAGGCGAHGGPRVARPGGMKLKLAIVRQRYNPFGGAERFIARALPALERAGADVTLICRKEGGWGARRVLRVDPFYIGKVWRDWSFARAARAAWRRTGFDLVQSHERIPGCDVYRAGDGVHRRWLELRALAAPFLERLGIVLNPYHRYVCAAERRLFEHPRLRAVICNSRMVSDEIRRGFRIAPEKLHVVYSGVDL